MKLRPVEFWTTSKQKIFRGVFHTWGVRGDENLKEFFGVVENDHGECIELDPQQITFTDNSVI